VAITAVPDFIPFARRPVSLHCEDYVCVCVCVCVCVYDNTHISDCVQTVYKLLLLPNNVASETFLHKSGAVRSVDFVDLFHLPTLMHNSFIH
jgi:hypothetical protein